MINFESFSNVLSSLLADLISSEAESSECPCEMRRELCDRDKEGVIT